MDAIWVPPNQARLSNKKGWISEARSEGKESQVVGKVKLTLIHPSFKR